MDWQATLKERFIESIRKTFPTPTPLIGDRWFVFCPDGRPADCQFVGVGRLAKATGLPPDRVAKLLVKNLSLRGLGARVEIDEERKINVWVSKPRAAQSGEPSEPREDEPSQDA
ncbi:MAG TPA: hypothetical protein VNA25_14470 [Phycisphaerae bacterium]|nr:hypothetical protein [Phycisphaerae bacterium]